MSSISNSIQQGNERKILVRSVNRDIGKILCGNVEESYRREDFHLVDLELNKIYQNWLPSLPRACRRGSIVASGQSIFIFGGLTSIDEKSSLFKFAKSHRESHFHTGASRFHFDPAHLKDGLVVPGQWAPAPPMNTRNVYLCTCLNGDVYSFGCSFFFPEVLYVDTTNIELLGPWKSLVSFPPELRNCSAYPVIPDPTNNRILVHFYGGQLPSTSLYAFYPPDRQNQDNETGVWQRLNSNFLGWEHVVDAALLDGVLFLHGSKFPNLVRAYEVDTGEYLEVQWSSRDIEKDISVDDIYFLFDSLFCLDDTNKVLCLAVYSPVDLRSCMKGSIKGGDPNSPSKTFLLFFKFKVKRCHSTIILTPIDTHSYEIESTTQVLSFLLL